MNEEQKKEEKELIKRLVDGGIRCIKTYTKDGEEFEAFYLGDNYTYWYYVGNPGLEKDTDVLAEGYKRKYTIESLDLFSELIYKKIHNTD